MGVLTGLISLGAFGAMPSDALAAEELKRKKALANPEQPPDPHEAMVDQVIAQRPDQTRSPWGAGVESFLGAFKPIRKLAVEPYEAYRSAEMQPQVQAWQDEQARRISDYGPAYDAAQASMMTGNQWAVPYMMYGLNHTQKTGPSGDKVFDRGAAAGAGLYQTYRAMAASPLWKGKAAPGAPAAVRKKDINGNMTTSREPTPFAASNKGWAQNVSKDHGETIAAVVDMLDNKESPEYKAFAAEMQTQGRDPDKVLLYILSSMSGGNASLGDVYPGSTYP